MFNKEYRDSSLICLTETWLENKDADGTVHIDNFNLIRGDRIKGNKQHGGGVCIYVNERWCKNVTLKCTYCDDNVEYLTVACRPFYLPREFSNIYVTVIYVPPDGDYAKAAEQLTNCAMYMDENCSNGINIILGDFNGCEIEKLIPNYYQYVKCTTRQDKILDLIFCNIKNAYKVIKRPPLGSSDHNMLYCIPIYRQKYKTQKCKKVHVKQWTDESVNTLKACFECTEWDLLFDDEVCLDDNVDVITSYLKFCTDMIIPTKEVKIYANNKPWLTKDVKELVNKKKSALSNNRVNLKDIQKELCKKIKNAKHQYKVKVENLFKSNNSKDAWRGLKYLCGYNNKNSMPEPECMQDYVNGLNEFYARFDDKDFSAECSCILNDVCSRACERIVLSEEDVMRALSTAKPGKAAGPDKICGRVIKSCKHELAKPLLKLYQASLDQCIVPSKWKTSLITPVPKIKIPLVMNDLRPVALTDVLMKCFESIVKRYLCKNFKNLFDSMQFAYKENRCVDDAVTTLLEIVCFHLEKPRAYSRVLFVDFSSAFNTIQPHVMIRKLLDMNVNGNIIRWIYSYLTARPQYVKLNGVMSKCILTNTGAPQGCVLSPLLFTIYTNDCNSKHQNCTVIKYADDTVVVGNILDNDECMYRDQVRSFVEWCHSNFLNLNVKKTMEMILDFRKNTVCHSPLLVDNETVQVVHNYKYLGVMIDDKLTFANNVHHLYVKCIKRLHHLRMLKNIGVDKHILHLFYRSIIESVMCYCIITWFGPSHKKDHSKLSKIVRSAKKMGIETRNLNAIYDEACLKLVKRIMKDDTHPLFDKFIFLRSGKRLCVPKHRTNRYAKTFVPHGVKIFNHKA